MFLAVFTDALRMSGVVSAQLLLGAEGLVALEAVQLADDLLVAVDVAAALPRRHVGEVLAA